MLKENEIIKMIYDTLKLVDSPHGQIKTENLVKFHVGGGNFLELVKDEIIYRLYANKHEFVLEQNKIQICQAVCMALNLVNNGK